MPVYKYLCLDCNSTFDFYTSVSNRYNSICKSCNSNNTKILIQPVNFMPFGTRSPKIYEMPDDFTPPEHDVDTTQAHEYYGDMKQ